MGVALETLASLVADLKEDEVLRVVGRRLLEGEDPLRLIDECRLGIMEVGRRYEARTYYISGLIMAGEIMQQVSERILPILRERITSQSSGRIMLATVQGDIHYIGKRIFKILMECFGFTIHDIGEDVAPSVIVQKSREFSPHVIGLSCLLNGCYDAMADTILQLKRDAMGEGRVIPILIGGQVDEMVKRHVGADYWAKDAMEGVRICQKIFSTGADSNSALSES